MVYFIIGFVIAAIAAIIIITDERRKSGRELREERQRAEEVLAQERHRADDEQAKMRQSHEEAMARQREHEDQALAQERQRADQQRAADREQWQEQIKHLRDELRANASEILQAKRVDLQAANNEQIQLLLTPLKTQFEAFQKAINEASQQAATDKANILAEWSKAMATLRDHQDLMIRNLTDQTNKIGNDAVTLARALRGDSKKQGDFGEMILDNLLECSGLIKGRDYEAQVVVKSADQRNVRPDVIVHLPEGKKVVIDSKMSLTAYTKYIEVADTAEKDECERLLREHVQSVRAHINELSKMNYDKLVSNNVGYVLMFIPNETSYLYAIKQDQSLLTEAYKKHVIMLSPANMLMALQLVYVLGQRDRQDKNTKAIVYEASLMYDKFTTFTKTYKRIVTNALAMQKILDEATGTLLYGKDNLKSRFENILKLGATSRLSITELDEAQIMELEKSRLLEISDNEGTK